MKSMATRFRRQLNTKGWGRLPTGKFSEQGLTLLEVLVAISVIGVVVTSFTPSIFLAVGTRVQNRRAEQAMQLAQAEVDRVRRLVELGAYIESASPYTSQSLPPVGGSEVDTQPVPSGFTDDPTQINPTKALRVDVNGDGTYDFLVQVFRNQKVTRNNKTYAFNMGVRVYSAVVTQNFGALENPPKGVASLRLTTAEGAQRRLPLAALYTTVVRSDVDNSLCHYHELVQGTRPTWCSP